MRMTTTLGWVWLLGLAACPAVGDGDSGVIDAGSGFTDDGGTIDDGGGRLDAGADAGRADAGRADGGRPTLDAGVALDAGDDDSGVFDAGIVVGEDAGVDGGARVDAGPSEPFAAWTLPTTWTLQEEAMSSLALSFDLRDDVDETDVVVEVDALPPGMKLLPDHSALAFRPDFIQGGQSWSTTLALRLTTTNERIAHTLHIHVEDSVQPPWPRVVGTDDLGAVERLTLAQDTDVFLDAASEAGRSFEAKVMAPKTAPPGTKLPVRIVLHGFNGSLWDDAWEGEFRISPADPDNTYWWGYLDPTDPTQAPPYTLRRVLHLLEWVLTTYPHADAENVYVEGLSMGGAGALLLGLLHARHINVVDSRIGQTVAQNHRPSRRQQLTLAWGPDDGTVDDGRGANDQPMSPWARQDMTRALRDDDDGWARGQWVFLKHGKDDPIIHFGAVSWASPSTGMSFYDALQQLRVAHVAAWDEGAHGVPDPVLADGWWQAGWNPVFDDTAWLRRRQVFPAYTSSSFDDDPGTGGGNGSVVFKGESGYAADVGVVNDTGWDGDVAGVRNRHLRWNSNRAVDEVGILELALYADVDAGAAPAGPGRPPVGDGTTSSLPIVVDVTPRRAQRFRPRAGASVRWTYGMQSGVVRVDDEGSITIPDVEVTDVEEVLQLTLD